jgi:uncharacterized protein (TIGR04255 family)
MPSTIDDLFPPSPRELYSKAPEVLLLVVCEFKFPRILRLDKEPPAGFQEAIARKFPLYEQAINFQVPEGAHQFMTEDRNTTVSLSSENMALIVKKTYTKWEDFRALLEMAIGALVREYTVPFFSRIGLRYQDVIHRQSLGLGSDLSWLRLIKPELLGPFPFAQFEANVTGATHRLNLSLPDGTGALTLRHGLVNVAGQEGVGYMLDFDFSRQPKTETNDALNGLDHFHDLAGRAFRWCLTDELRAALGPTEILVSTPHRAAGAA